MGHCFPFNSSQDGGTNTIAKYPRNVDAGWKTTFVDDRCHIKFTIWLVSLKTLRIVCNKAEICGVKYQHCYKLILAKNADFCRKWRGNIQFRSLMIASQSTRKFHSCFNINTTNACSYYRIFNHIYWSYNKKQTNMTAVVFGRRNGDRVWTAAIPSTPGVTSAAFASNPRRDLCDTPPEHFPIMEN